ncbi:hypothetical protein GCM10012287_02890 [Streptomyces daqingensis]|uniref:Uncharacterized protein n=1 Tax=Streptomyces daqingensis TaxID=1472640 RepID=A0ABQ2LRK2_9ACTN|nr:hypothetical protein [Streptomyces daqingensis]GGO42313.1 hypothetical protein GCM10012287_02890 [Streptomyces daqingensis]
MSVKKDPSRRANSRGAKGMSTYTAERGRFPRLPTRYRDNAEVRRWWDTWRNVPWADRFTATEVQSLLDTLPLVEALHAGPEGLRYRAEIRRVESLLGATAYDRRRLDIYVEVIEPDDASGQPSGADDEIAALDAEVARLEAEMTSD